MPFFIPIAVAAGSAAASGAAAAAGAVAGAASSLGVTGGLLLAGTGASAGLSVMQGKQQAKDAKNAADAAQNQAEMEARRIETKSEYEQKQLLRERQLTLGRINRIYGQSGLQLAGSPIKDLEETAKNMTMDVLMNNYNATEEAKAVRYSGASTAKIYKAQGRSARTAGYLGAGQSILGGFSAYSSMPKKVSPTNNFSSTAMNNARGLNQSVGIPLRMYA